MHQFQPSEPQQVALALLQEANAVGQRAGILPSAELLQVSSVDFGCLRASLDHRIGKEGPT
jgi:hypothetical protein